MPLPSLAEVLRFDVTVEWVMQRWPRVTTGLPQLQLQGYRVPLVTGTSLSDVAGSLTYYFNARQQVQRITLRGTDRRSQRLGEHPSQPLPFRPPVDQRSGRGAVRSGRFEQSARRLAEDSIGAGGDGQPAVHRGSRSIW